MKLELSLSSVIENLGREAYSRLMEVKCPSCGKAALYAPENHFRPFCSERCKLIDLGAWASEKYAIPVTPRTEEELEQIAREEEKRSNRDSDEGSEDDSNLPRH